MTSPIRAGSVVSDPSGTLVGDVLGVFDAGDIGPVATIAWRKHGTAAVQFNVGARWLTVREDLSPDPDASAALHDCSVCGTAFADTGTTPDRYGTCGYGQCMEAAWPQHAYLPRPNQADKPTA